MRCIAIFIFQNEEKYLIIRDKIVNYLIAYENLFNQLEIETEIGLLNFHEYLNYIKNPGAWSGELEKYAIEDIFKINIVDYIGIKENNNIFTHQFFYDYNHDKMLDKHLCILSQMNN